MQTMRSFNATAVDLLPFGTHQSGYFGGPRMTQSVFVKPNYPGHPCIEMMDMLLPVAHQEIGIAPAPCPVLT